MCSGAVWALGLGIPALAASAPEATLDAVYEKLYSFEFSDARVLLNAAQEAHPGDPLLPVTGGAVDLFAELNRLGILASSFYRDQGEKLKKHRLTPSVAARDSLFANLERARELASARLAANPDDADAHFALALAAGLECNYAVFIEKRRLHALPLARLSHHHALRTLDIDPDYHDARLIPGLNEYVVGSLPFFVEWFVRFEGVDGSKTKAVADLTHVARSGRYLGSYARILLAMIHIRERRYAAARAITAELAAGYPNNLLFQTELERLNRRVAGGG